MTIDDLVVPWAGEPGNRVTGSSFSSQPILRIECDGIVGTTWGLSYLKLDVRADVRVGAAGTCDYLSGGDVLTLSNVEPGEVVVGRVEPVAVLNDHRGAPGSE